ncbi:MAG: AAA family ATPase [Actinomycetota bacterium]|nr:AAA family ATPase [Actinomycetota bacterium]
MRTCPNCGRESPADFAFCPHCAAPLGEPEPAGGEVRKTVTVLFADVTGSTSLGERLDPESMRRVMGRYFNEMRAVLERHGGTVEKFIGDAVMAVFGVPVVHEDDALRAVRAAAEMRDALRLLNKELERDFGTQIAARIGVNTGEVVAAQGARAEHLVTGDAVNVAARLEQAAAPGDVLIGETTHRLVRDAVEAEPVEPLALKGKAEPVAAHRLVLVHPLAAGLARRMDSPMVGRDRQLRQLGEAFESAVEDRACYLFTVLGSAGVGKSRLIQEFLGSVSEEATVLRGRCLSYGEGITFWPVAEAIAQAARVDEIHGPDEAGSRLLSLLEPEDEAPLVADRLLQVLGLGDSSAPTQEMFWAVRRLFESMARRRPLAVVVDDIHWAEPTLLDLIEHIADWTRDAPILLVCPARPELLDTRPGWGGGKLNATTILLEPLSAEESDTLVTNLLGQADLAEEARARITEAAEGNPLFVEQMLAMLIDDGLLVRREDGRWRTSGDLSLVAVPPSVQALLAARLDRLGSEERDVIGRAAVEGKEFHAAAVEALLPEGARSRASELLRGLVRRELIRPSRGSFPGQEAYRFRHQLIRDAAYEAVPKGERADLHRRFAGWLEVMAGDRAQEYEEFVGYHLEQAHRFRSELGPVVGDDLEVARRAGTLLAAAGHRAEGRGDALAARNLLGRAIALLTPPDPVRVRALINLNRALFVSSEFAEAGKMLEEAVDEARALPDRRLEIRAELERWQLRSQADPEFSVQDAEAFARRAVIELEELGDDEGLAHAWLLVSNGPWIRAQWSRMREPLGRAIEYARRAGDLQLERWLEGWRMTTLLWGETPAEDALPVVREWLERSKDSLVGEATARRIMAGFLALIGEFDEARGHLERAREISRDVGQTISLATLGFHYGPLELLAGDPVAAERELRPGVEELKRIGERGWLSSLAPILAEALYRQGRFDEADEFAALGRDAANPQDNGAQFWWRTVKAKLLAAGGDLEGAEQLAREAVELVLATDEVAHQGDAYMDLAEVLRMAGRTEGAAAALRQAIDRYKGKGATVPAARAREALASLAV